MTNSYAQKSNQGCLIVCLSYLFSKEPNQDFERAILNDGLFRFRDNYTIGSLLAFLNYFQDELLRTNVFIDNKYYQHELETQFSDNKIKLVQQKIDSKFLDTLSTPFIAFIDSHILGNWEHTSHFVLITRKTAKTFWLFDPWTGKELRISKRKLTESISSLRKHIRICPIVITRFKG